MIRSAAIVRTYVSEERISSIIRVTRVSELGKTFLRNIILTRVTRSSIPEDGINHSHRRGNLKSYIELAGLCSGDVMCLL
jgi:hypothetical protein